MNDSLGKRIKEQYEHRTRYFLPRRTYTIIRVDGKAFHTFTRNMKKPFDSFLMKAMDQTAEYMCKNIEGAKLAYVQSDEISILITDFKKHNTCAFFNGNIQKIASVSASMATLSFNENYSSYMSMPGTPLFDSRVFTIPDPIEVENYFIWRQQDASRNSVQMAARSVYSHNECENKNNPQLQDMLHEKRINWNDYSAREKRGGLVSKQIVVEYMDRQGGQWVSEGAPIFTQERDFFKRSNTKNRRTNR